jgi:hypothetical protein
MTHVLVGPALFDERIPDRANCVYWRDDLSVGPVPVTEENFLGTYFLSQIVTSRFVV